MSRLDEVEKRFPLGCVVRIHYAGICGVVTDYKTITQKSPFKDDKDTPRESQEFSLVEITQANQSKAWHNPDVLSLLLTDEELESLAPMRVLQRMTGKI